MKKLLCLFILIGLLSASHACASPTLIYDTLDNQTLYKVIKIDDDLNIKYLNDYKYEVYVNNQFLGYYLKDELIFVPDNSDVTIYVPSPIKTDISSSWELTKSMLINVLGFVMTFGIIALIIFLFAKKLLRKH